MENFIFKYYTSPIIDRTGYNLVNTATYAIIALIALFLIYSAFKKYKIKIDRSFVYAVIPFVLLGSTVRVITDAIDNAKFLPTTPIHQLVLNSHLYDYGFWTSSPGIYFVVSFLLFASMIILSFFKRLDLLPYVGLALWLPHFLMLVPFFTYWFYAIPVFLLAIIPGYLTWKYTKNDIYSLMVFSQSFDGSATFLTLDYGEKFTGIKYFEQHVFSNGLCMLFNTCATFYFVKVGISILAAHLLYTEKEAGEQEKYFIALVILIMGLAPGLRDLLRIMAGT